MAYARYDPRQGPREQSRYSDDRFRDRDMRDRDMRGRDRDREERGFFERAGDEIASWFGDEEAERRRRRDEQMGGRDDYGRDYEPSRSMSRDYEPGRSMGRSRFDRDDDRGFRSSREREPWGGGEREDRGYRPITGDYGRSEGFFAASGYPSRDEGRGRPARQSNWERDEYRRTSFAGDRPQHDLHYQQWRQRQIDELDRDYDEYRREHQSKFENDFGSWRERRQSKRQMLGQIREHMEVVGNDGEHVGTVDRVAGDRLILAKSDPDSGGVHHSLSCTEIDRIDGDRVLLDINATEARIRWRDESRERALFEREDQGEAGPQSLERSFSGTYR
jgi:hypothetical protein